jgi:lantibiotic modifying enzyme
MQLFEMTGEREFLAAARGAYAYEDTLFIEEIGEWLDVRSAESRTQALAAQSAPSAWCHGGGGIGLSRAEAARIDRERSEEYCTSVRIAAASTRKALEHALETPRSDATLCHGIAGHMEILNILQRRGYGEELGRMALVAANRLAALCDDGHDWPSGRPGGEPDQSLMIGDAGIGHALLRLCDDRILSPVLLIG